ncbi:hypothetical protein [Flagellimonas onchidii]|uniref:hypothetical protein n=1 Tax=Flagellimonas onchidii TaxID=2562684 RepID=UPI0010A5C603|nr:hypothetical protein [Allomuricauda onchidii]
MKTKIIFCFLIAFAFKSYGQNDSILKYTYIKENIVASAIDGTWKAAEGKYQLTFKKDTTVLRLLSPKYYEVLRDKIIYHVGHLSGIWKNTEIKDVYFILIEHHGNPIILAFEEKDGDIVGSGEGGFFLFIAKGFYKEEDKLIVVDDYRTGPALEFVRIE